MYDDVIICHVYIQLAYKLLACLLPLCCGILTYLPYEYTFFHNNVMEDGMKMSYFLVSSPCFLF